MSCLVCHQSSRDRSGGNPPSRAAADRFRRGQIVASDLLEDCVTLAITEVMGRKNLDTDISWFQNRPSTIENIALFAWRNIAVIMKPHPHDVDEVRVKVEGCWRGKEPGEGSGRWTVATYRGTSGCLIITRGSGAQELMVELDRRNGAGLAVKRTSSLVKRGRGGVSPPRA